MPNGGDWKETFKFFVKELTEVYLPQLKEIWDLILPVSPLGGKPEKDIGGVPQPVPVPPPPPTPLPELSKGEQMFPVFPMQQIGGEPPDFGPISPDRTPFPPWDPLLPYGYPQETKVPVSGPPDPWWRNLPPYQYSYDWYIAQASRTDSERKA